ncbi:MAG: DUF2255 family protein [Proteobacteria bacterium]|nr:DUF2255 family protein [Pseudomonadota bacterium]
MTLATHDDRISQVTRNLAERLKIPALILIAISLLACEPSDRRPGLWLSGNEVQTFPTDWTFTDDHREVFVQVVTPYFLPHSVTIWCAQISGTLYIAARSPETKNWVGWIEKDNNLRLKIGEDVYDARAVPVNDEETLKQVRLAYSRKYQLSESTGGEKLSMKYWSIAARN